MVLVGSREEEDEDEEEVVVCDYLPSGPRLD